MIVAPPTLINCQRKRLLMNCCLSIYFRHRIFGRMFNVQFSFFLNGTRTVSKRLKSLVQFMEYIVIFYSSLLSRNGFLTISTITHWCVMCVVYSALCIVYMADMPKKKSQKIKNKIHDKPSAPQQSDIHMDLVRQWEKATKEKST